MGHCYLLLIKLSKQTNKRRILRLGSPGSGSRGALGFLIPVFNIQCRWLLFTWTRCALLTPQNWGCGPLWSGLPLLWIVASGAESLWESVRTPKPTLSSWVQLWMVRCYLWVSPCSFSSSESLPVLPAIKASDIISSLSNNRVVARLRWTSTFTALSPSATL